MKIFDSIRNPLVVLMSLIFCVTSSGCSTSYDSMVEEYNNCYVVKTTEKAVPTVGSKDFDQNKMIKSSYTVNIKRGVIIVAPPGAKKYEWTIENDTRTFTDQVLNYKPPEDVELGVGYEVTLVVTYNPNNNFDYHYYGKSSFTFVE